MQILLEEMSIFEGMLSQEKNFFKCWDHVQTTRGAICFRTNRSRASGRPCGSSYGRLKFWPLFFFMFLRFRWVFLTATRLKRCVVQFATIITNRHVLRRLVARAMAIFVFLWSKNKSMISQNKLIVLQKN